jgi:hypothetical protein
MRIATVLVTTLFLVPTIARAQSGTTIEIGTGVGASILTDGGTLTLIGAPGAGIVGQAPLYASFFFGRGMMVQPEMSLNILTGEGSTLTTLGFAAQVGYLFSGAGVNSPYVALSGALQYVTASGFDSDSEFGAGARFGYRVRVNQGFAVSLEGGFRRWFDSDLNEITIGIRLGGILTAPK